MVNYFAGGAIRHALTIIQYKTNISIINLQANLERVSMSNGVIFSGIRWFEISKCLCEHAYIFSRFFSSNL